MVEILAGDKFANAVYSLKLASAKCVYYYQPPKDSQRENYQVWLWSEDDFDKICSVKDDYWKEDWGWWRYAKGSNLGYADQEYVVNNEKLIAWDGSNRSSWLEECKENCSDHKRGLCDGAEKDFEQCFGSRVYPDIISYLLSEIGASTEKNVCACTVDLARQNNLTLAEFFKKYLG